MRPLGPANFLYADGDTLFAHGHCRFQPSTGSIASPGLHVLSRHCALAQIRVNGDGVSVAGGFQDIVLVASFPLSDEGWRPLADGEVSAITSGEVRGSRFATPPSGEREQHGQTVRDPETSSQSAHPHRG